MCQRYLLTGLLCLQIVKPGSLVLHSVKETSLHFSLENILEASWLQGPVLFPQKWFWAEVSSLAEFWSLHMTFRETQLSSLGEFFI
jgi:hypothetical protein